MGRLSFLLIFYWILLFENGTTLLGPLINLGNGLEIRPSLLVKIIFLLVNIIILVHFNKKHAVPVYLIILSGFLLISTFSVLIISPEHFINALAINIHIQLMLNIILFIRFNTYSFQQIKAFLKYLRLFALINAVLVIISYFFPYVFSEFEYTTSETGITRAFGIMGDEVSVFLSFFLYEAFISKRPVGFLLYLTAILMTGGLGATFTVVMLAAYHLFFVMKKTRKNLYLGAFTFMVVVFASIFFISTIRNVGVVKRLQNISENSTTESVGMRLLSFKVAFEMIRDRPFFGYGYGNYGTAVIDKYKPEFVDAGRESLFNGSAKIILKYTFNPFLQMMGESGFVGLVIFIWFLVKLSIGRVKGIEETNPEFFRFNQVSRAWLIVFILTTLSANWFLPSSFLFLLVVSLVGINEKLNLLYLGQHSETTD